MTDSELVKQTALDFLSRYGPDAVPRLLERAEADTLTGDYFSAQAWLDIAAAAERIRSLMLSRLTG
jgi:hypothetical protein